MILDFVQLPYVSYEQLAKKWNIYVRNTGKHAFMRSFHLRHFMRALKTYVYTFPDTVERTE